MSHVVAAILAAILPTLAFVVWFDAGRRDWSGRTMGRYEWTALTALLLPVGIVGYVIRRPGTRRQPTQDVTS